MDILFSNRFVTIAFYSKRNCLIQTWKAFCSSAEFREGQMKTAELFREHKCKFFISDATNAGLLQKEDTDWVAAVITPQLVECGMDILHMVIATSAFTQMTLQNLMFVENVNKTTKLVFFESLEKALQAVDEEFSKS